MATTTNPTKATSRSATGRETQQRAASRSHEPAAAPMSRSADSDSSGGDRYVLPLIHTSVSSKVVDVGFWGTLLGAVAVGAVDPPLGLLIGAGVVVARHHSQTGRP